MTNLRISGARSRVQRSVRVYQCQGREVDDATAGGFGCYVCLAAFASSRILHKAEAYITSVYDVLRLRYIKYTVQSHIKAQP